MKKLEQMQILTSGVYLIDKFIKNVSQSEIVDIYILTGKSLKTPHASLTLMLMPYSTYSTISTINPCLISIDHSHHSSSNYYTFLAAFLVGI